MRRAWHAVLYVGYVGAVLLALALTYEALLATVPQATAAMITADAPSVCPRIVGSMLFGVRLSLFACALPFLAGVLLSLLSLRDDDRLTHELPTSPSLDALRPTWEEARERARRAHALLPLYACGFGVLASIALLFPLPSVFVGDLADLGCVSPQRAPTTTQLGAMTALVASATSFVLTTSQLFYRAAKGDLTLRVITGAARSLLYAVLAAIGGAALAHVAELDLTPAKALFGGVVAGLVGERIVMMTFDAVAIVFGVSNGGDDLDDFEHVDGIDEDERLRLKEQGVQSLQGLAYAVTAGLFFGTRYPLERIIDWQDQALLLCRVKQRARGRRWTRPKTRGVGDCIGVDGRLIAREDVPKSLLDALPKDPMVQQIRALRHARVR